MEIKNLHEPFEIEFHEALEYSFGEKRNTFFEMAYIIEGNGLQIIDHHQLPYAPGDLLLIFPDDTHGFKLTRATKFFFVRFNLSYLKAQGKEGIRKLEFIFHNHDHLPGCILKNKADKPLVRAMVEALMTEHIDGHPYQNEVITQIINTLIAVAARNLLEIPSTTIKMTSGNNPVDLVNYIHYHIHLPEKLKAEKIAEHFNISPTYISEYFKHKTGESLHGYITAYKLKLVEARLRYTNMRISEIVIEFGFTDASHLNRAFKKYKGIGPSEFRKSLNSELHLNDASVRS